MKNLVLLIFLLGIIQCSYAADCSKHPIYCQIVKNKKTINKKLAMKISNIIYSYSRSYHIPANIFTAILMQESGYNYKATNCTTGYTYENQLSTVCTDFGISQIWFRTANRYGFNLDRLTNDLKYSIESGMIVLKDFKKAFGDNDINWWTRYNCGWKGTTKRDTCQIYKKLVERYL